MSEQVTEKEKAIIIKLEIHQFEHLLVAFGSISRELKNIVSKQERLEEAITKLEAELKLIRVEIGELKEKN